MKTNLKYDSKQLKKELKQAVSEQCEILCEENQKCYDALRYVRPRTKLESMHAELCLTNKNYANILGLGKLMKNHQELTDDDWNEFINKHKVNLRFLNNLLKVVPDFISTIRKKLTNKSSSYISCTIHYKFFHNYILLITFSRQKCLLNYIIFILLVHIRR